MRVSGIDGMILIDVKEGVELPKFIRTLTIETAEEEQELRLFLTGALKVDERGCRALVRDFGVNALAVNPDVSNGDAPLGSDSSNDSGLKFDYSLDEKLRIIDTLASALKKENSVFYEHTKETEEKLLALIRSI
ncbi:hypothetical protein B9T38_13705 [Acinetobacter sp. ANC 4218]|uniref:hypothetical protein n=1 Tax=Acinetobacter sp. ANC 4218 TaxID=1977880 RepID=UPI000A32CF9B|nr:hypothetical protein [Acinetobacter sp. ANC 4218]OTG70069.1 hypothetical protein B9T38_13705 [Acinetobacter sp. ANC 4218]